MKTSLVKGNFKGYVGFDKEEAHMDMIRTGRYKNYGQIEDQAAGIADVETSVYLSGEVYRPLFCERLYCYDQSSQVDRCLLRMGEDRCRP